MFYFETDNLRSILLTAAMQKRTSRREAKCNMSKFKNDGNARMQTVLRELVCLRPVFLEGKDEKIRIQWNLHITDTYRIGPTLSSVVERCPLYGGVTFCHSVFWDENI